MHKCLHNNFSTKPQKYTLNSLRNQLSHPHFTSTIRTPACYYHAKSQPNSSACVKYSHGSIYRNLRSCGIAEILPSPPLLAFLTPYPKELPSSSSSSPSSPCVHSVPQNPKVPQQTKWGTAVAETEMTISTNNMKLFHMRFTIIRVPWRSRHRRTMVREREFGERGEEEEEIERGGFPLLHVLTALTGLPGRITIS